MLRSVRGRLRIVLDGGRQRVPQEEAPGQGKAEEVPVAATAAATTTTLTTAGADDRASRISSLASTPSVTPKTGAVSLERKAV